MSPTHSLLKPKQDGSRWSQSGRGLEFNSHEEQLKSMKLLKIEEKTQGYIIVVFKFPKDRRNQPSKNIPKGQKFQRSRHFLIQHKIVLSNTFVLRCNSASPRTVGSGLLDMYKQRLKDHLTNTSKLVSGIKFENLAYSVILWNSIGKYNFLKWRRKKRTQDVPFPPRISRLLRW